MFWSLFLLRIPLHGLNSILSLLSVTTVTKICMNACLKTTVTFFRESRLFAYRQLLHNSTFRKADSSWNEYFEIFFAVCKFLRLSVYFTILYVPFNLTLLNNDMTRNSYFFYFWKLFGKRIRNLFFGVFFLMSDRYAVVFVIERCCLSLCMVQFHLLPSLPRACPQDLPFFRFSAVYSLPSGTQKDTISHSRGNIIFISMQNHIIYIIQPETLS